MLKHNLRQALPAAPFRQLPHESPRFPLKLAPFLTRCARRQPCRWFNVGSLRILNNTTYHKRGGMDATDSKCKPTLGFLTVVEHSQYGLFGGYLILNTAGRPLEFHCTAPIKPNRAQEILYGPTLESFLYGEQIGQTLISQGSAVPLLVCTDREPALAAREHVSAPMVLVLPPEVPSEPTDEESKRFFRIDAPHRGPRLVTFQLGRNRLALPERADEDRRLIGDRLADLAESFDLSEPFQRIRDAIEEAQQAVR